MGHFAKVVDGKVTQVIVAEPDFFQTFVDSSPGEWIQTSYNTLAGEHIKGGTPLRGNFAGIGFTYDKENDVFYAPKPYPSWVINQDTWTWESPIPNPNLVNEYATHSWDEETLSWVENKAK